MSSRQQLLIDIIAPVVESLGYELWAIDYQSQGRYTLLRIYIESEQGISLDDCEKTSRQVSSVLDVEDPISGQYTLEVSSPGLDRPLLTLDHFQRYVGEQIALKLSRSFEGRKNFHGLLKAVEGDEIVVQVDDDEYWLPIELIDRANLVPQF